VKYKLTKIQASEILRRRRIYIALTAEAALLSNKALGEKFNKNHKSIGRIINRHRWKGVKKLYGDMTDHDAQLIRNAAKERDYLKSKAAEHSCKIIASECGMCESTVGLIGTGIRWPYLQTNPLPIKGVDY